MYSQIFMECKYMAQLNANYFSNALIRFILKKVGISLSSKWLKLSLI